MLAFKRFRMILGTSSISTDEAIPSFAKKPLKAAAEAPLSLVKQKLEALTDWTQESIHEVIHGTAEELDVKMGKVGMPLRVAVTGGAPSPSLDLTVYLIGKDACLRRIDKALAYIEKRKENVQ